MTIVYFCQFDFIRNMRKAYILFFKYEKSDFPNVSDKM